MMFRVWFEDDDYEIVEAETAEEAMKAVPNAIKAEPLEVQGIGQQEPK